MVKCPKCGSEDWSIIEQAKIYSRKSLIFILAGLLILYLLSGRFNADFTDVLIVSVIVYAGTYLMNRGIITRKCSKCNKVWRSKKDRE